MYQVPKVGKGLFLGLPHPGVWDKRTRQTKILPKPSIAMLWSQQLGKIHPEIRAQPGNTMKSCFKWGEVLTWNQAIWGGAEMRMFSVLVRFVFFCVL